MLKDKAASDDTYLTLEKRFRTISVPMSRDMFFRLPPNGAYKYEYVDGRAEITPEPHCCDLFLNLDTFFAPERDAYERWAVRPLAGKDWDALPGLAAGAFFRVAPFATFGDDALKQVMADELQKTRSGGDGPLIREACMVAEGEWGAHRKMQTVGAALATLRKGETNGGEPVPLLTWIFVSPLFKRHGISGGMLAGVVRVLKEVGHKRLESVVCTGNHASAMWHWRMGFEMGPSLRQKVRRRAAKVQG